MEPDERPYTWAKRIEGVQVVGFTDRGFKAKGPDATYEQDVVDFRSQMECLGREEQAAFAVVDFSNYQLTDYDNGRMVVRLLFTAQRRLKAQGGGLLVCNHPAQLNPDHQDFFHLDTVIGIYRSREEAIEAARSRNRQLAA
jgi:hypothetical protein